METNIPGEAGPPGVLDRQAGSRDAVTTLYAEHAVGLIRLAVVMLGDRAAAEEVVQGRVLIVSGTRHVRNPPAGSFFLTGPRVLTPGHSTPIPWPGQNFGAAW